MLRNSFDLDLDEIDTESCKNFILDSVIDWSYKLIQREREPILSGYFVRRVTRNVVDLIKKVREADGNMIIISDDVGHAQRATDKFERLSQEVIGKVNGYIADIADEVYVVEFGVLRKIK